MYRQAMYEVPIDNFLSDFYTQMGNKLQKMIELNSLNPSTVVLKELYESKTKVINALDYLSNTTSNQEMQILLHTLATMVLSPDEKDWKQALEFCNKMR